jgi:hypothetical protein
MSHILTQWSFSATQAKQNDIIFSRQLSEQKQRRLLDNLNSTLLMRTRKEDNKRVTYSKLTTQPGFDEKI